MRHNLGVVYGVMPSGALNLYRRVDSGNETHRWIGPVEVGTGWGHFRQVLAGDDGVIYAVQTPPEPDVRIDPRQNHAAGDDLLWYRHLGRADGRFAWEGPKVVGTGWGRFSACHRRSRRCLVRNQ